MKKLLFILSLAAAFSSCGSKNKGMTSAHADKDLGALISSLQKSPQDYKWIHANGSAHYNGNGQDFTASTSLRLRKDSILWGNVNVFIEVARLLVNKDSVTMLNRPQKQYSVFPVADLQKMLAIPNLTLSSLQDILMAYPPFALNNKYEFLKRENDYKLSYTGPNYREEMTIDAATLRMKEYVFKINESRKIRITYEDFSKEGNLILPNKINFELESPEKTQILIEISSYTFADADEAPFSIPSSYRKQ